MDRNWHTMNWLYNKHQLYPVTFIHESVIRGLSRKVKRHTCTVLGALQKTCKTDRLADREKIRNALIAYEKRTGSRPSPLLSSKGVFLFDDIAHKSEKLLKTLQYDVTLSPCWTRPRARLPQLNSVEREWGRMERLLVPSLYVPTWQTNVAVCKRSKHWLLVLQRSLQRSGQERTGTMLSSLSFLATRVWSIFTTSLLRPCFLPAEMRTPSTE